MVSRCTAENVGKETGFDNAFFIPLGHQIGLENYKLFCLLVCLLGPPSGNLALRLEDLCWWLVIPVTIDQSLRSWRDHFSH